MDLVLAGVDRGEVLLDAPRRPQAAGADTGGDLGGGPARVVSAATSALAADDRRHPEATVLAPAAPRRAPRRGRGTGARRRRACTLTSGYGWVIGATSDRSRASMSAKWSSMSPSWAVACSISAGVRSSRARLATLATMSLVRRSDTVARLVVNPAQHDVRSCGRRAPSHRPVARSNRCSERRVDGRRTGFHRSIVDRRPHRRRQDRDRLVGDLRATVRRRSGPARPPA